MPSRPNSRTASASPVSPAIAAQPAREHAASRGDERLLPFSAPELNDDEIHELTETLRSSWLSTGTKVHQFEREFARLIDVKHAIAVNCGATAFRLVVQTLELLPGDEVIMSPFAPVVAAELVRAAGATPRLVDITERGLHLSPELLAGAINDRTRAVIVSHVAGLPAEMQDILSIAREHRLVVVEDAGQALPATYQHRMVGGLGDISCFTFFAQKALTLGEGGVIGTNDGKLAERCRLLAMSPWSLVTRRAEPELVAESFTDVEEPGSETLKDTAAFNLSRSTKPERRRFSHTKPPAVSDAQMLAQAADGFQASMNELAASLGLAQLRKVTTMWQRRREIAVSFDVAFSRIVELTCPADRTDSQHAWHSYLLLLNRQRLRITRSQFLEELRARNIGATVLPPPLHLQPIYAEQLGYQPESCPVATQEYTRQIALPIYSRMSDDDVQRVIQAVEGIVKRSRSLPNRPR